MTPVTLMRSALLLLMLLGGAAAYAQEPTPTPEPLSLVVDGLTRTYSLHVPDTLTEPAPLVLVLHGRGGDGAGIARYTGFSDIADHEGFIVAYPDGLDGEWNAVKDIPGYPDTHDDTAFLIALADALARQYPVDLARVYVAGFSNGGFMAQRAACDQTGRFAAFASVAAAGFGGMRAVCPESGQAPMLLMHGTADNNVLWDGVSVTRGGRTVAITYPVTQTLAFWAEFNGCQPDATTTALPQTGLSPGTSVRVLRVDCPPETPVALYAVINGGHNWPGRVPTFPREIAGNVNFDIDAAAVIWDFFAPHTQPQPPA